MVSAMNNLNDEYDDVEQTLSEEPIGEANFQIPIWLRLAAVIVLSLLLAFSIALFVRYLISPTNGLEPSKVGLGNLIIFCLLGILFFLVPWEDFGLRIRKFGPFEFEQILNGQAEEHIDEVNDLRVRISRLEAKLNVKRTADESVEDSVDDSQDASQQRSEELQDRLLKFLRDHEKYAFSPARISIWGQKQKGFTELKDCTIDEIRRLLQSMVAREKLVTRISKNGNTLYRVPVAKR